ncbi:MAG: MBOAT family O-acyltransferase, partial [Chloroflexota bacterium]
FALMPFVRRFRNPLYFYIIVFSFIFYGWWDWRYIGLLLASGFIDFFAAQGMQRFPIRKRLFLFLSILGNVGSLGTFKYSLFFATNFDVLLASFGLETGVAAHLPAFITVAPVGISFYTFQSMSYTIDTYRGKLEPTNNIPHFFAYLSMFPQLVAGPIVRASDILDDMRTPPETTEPMRWEGTKLIATGYFMKVVLADNLAQFVNFAFGAPAPPTSPLYWWLIMLAFAFQIYYDFAGYSRIARGLAYWIGYEFPVNFDHPYVATSLQDFWRRWHITLSSWFRDYVYIPLGGSRRGEVRTYVNFWIVMLVSGLWHGAAWNFVIWGGVHALFYTVERYTKWPERVRQFPIIGPLSVIILTNMIVVIAWVFFRAPETSQAFFILGAMFGVYGVGVSLLDGVMLDIVFWVIAAMVFEYVLIRSERIESVEHHVVARWASAGVMALMLAGTVFLRGPQSEFIYFQF